MKAATLMSGSPMMAGSNLGLAGLDLGSVVFLLLKIDFWCLLTYAADT
jgi:hypothetical protein